MAGPEQYLRVAFAGREFLLPNSASVAIEQRDALQLNDSDSGTEVAWWQSRGKRLPVYSLDGNFRPVRNGDWQRAVFLKAQPDPIGLAANAIELLPRTEVRVEPYHPLGQAPTRGGHLFSAASVKGTDLVLVFDPRALAAYLQTVVEGV